tara:strand:+ start:228 stop:467 length:240 start_codon:yes stop_codon:yes gene_type:complete
MLAFIQQQEVMADQEEAEQQGLVVPQRQGKVIMVVQVLLRLGQGLVVVVAQAQLVQTVALQVPHPPESMVQAVQVYPQA